MATKGIHLKQTVLGCDEALGEDEVVVSGGMDGWDPVRIAGHHDRCEEAVRSEGTGGLWKRGDGRGAKPETSEDGATEEQNEEQEDAERGEAGEPARRTAATNGRPRPGLVSGQAQLGRVRFGIGRFGGKRLGGSGSHCV